MLRFVFGLAAALLIVAAHANPPSVGDLIISDAWARPTAEGMPTGVAYLSIINRGKHADTLLGARSSSATGVEFHRTSFEGGMARMRPAGTLTIEPGETLTASPGGLHLMLVDLKQPLIEGATVPLVLIFKDAGEVRIQLKIERREPRAPQ